MRKQARILEHVADAPPLDREAYRLAGGGEDRVTEPDLSLIRWQESRNDVHERRFAAARTAEEGGDPRRRGCKGGLQRKLSPALQNRHPQHVSGPRSAVRVAPAAPPQAGPQAPACTTTPQDAAPSRHHPVTAWPCRGPAARCASPRARWRRR